MGRTAASASSSSARRVCAPDWNADASWAEVAPGFAPPALGRDRRHGVERMGVRARPELAVEALKRLLD
jgi:hypothetical protein